MKYKIIASPVGDLKVVVTDKFLVAILWDNEKPGRVLLDPMIQDLKDPLILEVEKQLREYFDQKRDAFNLPLQAKGSPFQKLVWKALEQIPYGSTQSYKEIAEKINHSKAVRAVGAAIGRNPLSIIVPCHRVVGSNGNLTGFAGGVNRKRDLLNLEISKNRQQVCNRQI